MHGLVDGDTPSSARCRPIEVEADVAETREVVALEPFLPDGKLTISKLDGVFQSGSSTRNDIPTHLVVGQDVPAASACEGGRGDGPGRCSMAGPNPASTVGERRLSP